MSRTPLSPLTTSIIASAVTSVVVFFLLTVLSPQLRPEFAAITKGKLPGTATSSLQVPQTPSAVVSEDRAVIALAKKAQQAVVAVLVLSTAPPSQIRTEIFPFDNGLNPFLQQAPTPNNAPTTPSQIGGGSGFFVSQDGIVVTNKHVVDFPNAQFQVVTSDGKKYDAKIIATDPVLDIAFLKVNDAGPFSVLDFADSDTVQPGQTVIAIGNALDEFRNTVTKGVISGLNRRVFAGDGATTELIEEAIQTDAAINPGNSGGPLLDLQGRVVGINTAVSDQGQSLGFALPSNAVKRDAASVSAHGKIVRPFLGVRYQMIDEELVKQNQLSVDHGALVVRGTQRSELAVSPGSPADKAGIVENDIILELNGQPITVDHSLSSLIGRYAPGDTVTLKVLHAGKEKTVSLQLAELK